MVGFTPFKELRPLHLKQLILHGRHYCPCSFSTDLQNLISMLLTTDSQWPTLEEILWHAWLCQSEPPSCPPPDLLPEYPKPEILKLMSALGHNPEEIKESLRLKKYDHRMATYLIMEHQASQGTNICIRVKPEDKGVTPSPHPTDPTTSALLQNSGEPVSNSDSFLSGNRFDRKHELCKTTQSSTTHQLCPKSTPCSSCKKKMCWERMNRGIAAFMQKLNNCCLPA